MSNVKRMNREEAQFQYLGKWVNKAHFRAFVYNDKGEQELARSHQHFEALIGSGVWFASKDDASKKRKHKDGSLRADS
jgi:hypothetical protein